MCMACRWLASVKIQGLTELEKYLNDRPNVYVKIDRFRGDMEDVSLDRQAARASKDGRTGLQVWTTQGMSVVRGPRPD